MPRLSRPIDHEEKLSLVEHLDELRTRVIVSLLVLATLFGVCMWQADTILEVVNRPLDRAQEREAGSPDPLTRQEAFNRNLVDAAQATGPALDSVASSLRLLGGQEDLVPAAGRALRSASSQLSEAAAELQELAAQSPPLEERRPVTLGVAEPFTTTLTVAAYAALLLTLPLILYQGYAYALPALRPGERRIALPLMLTIPALFLGGVVFAYFVVLPGAVSFLQNFNADNFDILIQARAYYQFSVLMMAGIGLLFQIPVGVLAVTRLGIVSADDLKRNRPYFILGAAILAAIGNGSPDPMTMFMVLIPLVLLFEVSVRLAAWLERREAQADRQAGR